MRKVTKGNSHLLLAATLLGLPCWLACDGLRDWASASSGAGAPHMPATSTTDNHQEVERSFPDFLLSTADLPASWVQAAYPEVICPSGVCPTLEQALGSTVCQGPPTAEATPTWWNYQYVVSGCGLTSVHHAGFSYTGYWYEGFGTPPVAVLHSTDLAPVYFSQTRSIECPPSQQRTCAVCGDGFPSCSEPGWLPEPMPPPPGCACTPDGAGGASVSLECFCSIYRCPPLSEVALDCKKEPGDRRLSQRRATSSCGTLWFEGDQKLGYDAATGALVAAEASLPLPLPVTLPCYTNRVVAGTLASGAEAGAACTAPTACVCNDGSDAGAAAACTGTDWFDSLAGRFADPNPYGIEIEPRPDTPPEQPSLEADGCHFEYLGDWISCQDPSGPGLTEQLDGASFDECLSACLERADCTAVLDYHWLELSFGCSLFVSSCDAPPGGAWQQEDGGRYYRKVCSGG